MAEYTLSHKAVEDLAEIWQYTFNTWSEDQADNYYEALIETFKELAKRPLIGKAYREMGPDIRGFRVGNHLVFYNERGKTEIEILRILHGRMDLKNKLDD